MTIRQQIDQYICANPRELGEEGYYRKVADIFGVNSELVRSRWRRLRPNVDVNPVDLDKFDITSKTIKSYNGWVKNNGKTESKQLTSTRVDLKPKKIDFDLVKQKDFLIEEMKKYSPVVKNKIEVDIYEDIRNTALEINIPDLHIGKLAWGKETGEDYDISIACDRYLTAVRELIKRTPTSRLERIILPVGNDMINVDNKSNTTTAGTSVSCDSRFGKMFQTAKNLLIHAIDYLTNIAPVDVIVVPGNHDTVAMFTLGEVLDAWYHNNDLVTIYNQPTQRKYYQYGQTGLMFTHGNEEKHQELGMIFAAENPQLWASTKHRFCKVGHFHKTKKLSFVSVDEYQGFQVEIIPSLSGTDAWHNSKGYNSLKGAKAYLYHKDKGRIAEYSYYL